MYLHRDFAHVVLSKTAAAARVLYTLTRRARAQLSRSARTEKTMHRSAHSGSLSCAIAYGRGWNLSVVC